MSLPSQITLIYRWMNGSKQNLVLYHICLMPSLNSVGIPLLWLRGSEKKAFHQVQIAPEDRRVLHVVV